MNARDIMTSDPRCVRPTDSVRDAARLMREGDFGAVPVVEGEQRRLRGIITDRDIAIRCVAEGHDGNCKVQDHMTSAPRSVRPTDDPQQVMDLMKREQVRRVPVTDEDDRVIGMLAQADLALHFPNDQAVEETVARISEPGR